MKNKTTARHFAIFKEECEKWIAKYGLIGWTVWYEHKVDDSGNRAECRYNLMNRSVGFRLNPDWGYDTVTEYQLRKDAFHEVSENLLCRIRAIAQSRYINADEIDEEIHAIIRTLENVLWEGEDGNKF